MKVAFVLSGGASLGAVEVGMVQALAAEGIVADVLCGTSVGAVNAAYLAGHPGVAGAEGLAELWRSITRGHVFPLNPLQGLAGFLGRSDHLVDPGPLTRLIRSNLTFERIEDAAVPLHVVATDVISGHDRVLSSGPALEAILASAAIPGVFPPVVIDGRPYMDGGVTDNTPISHAATLAPDVIYVLPSGHPCSLERAPRGALSMVLQAITVMIGRQLVVDIERYRSMIDLRVVPPLCPLDVLPVDFSHSAELIERARSSTVAWLAAGQPSDGALHILAGDHSH
ncbi:MAG: patatin-like phospholipase family protein [Acidimicrobiales bacterium]